MSQDRRFLVTGALGCIGSWTVRGLLDQGADVVAFDFAPGPGRLSLLCSDEELARLPVVVGDITDTAGVAKVLDDYDITHVIHLAALQVPFCKADPVRGANVNVTGTVNVFEAVRHRADRIKGLAYASSAAVFGPPEMYPGSRVADNSPLAPGINIYGVYKQANELTAVVYANDYGVGSVGLRPFVAYGPGRDQGLTSGPSIAMIAAVAGEPYRIGYGGTTVFQYVGDVAEAFIRAVQAEPSGAQRLNIGGSHASVADVIAAIEEVVPEARGLITYDDVPLGVASTIDATGLDHLVGGMTYASLSDGVKRSVALFQQLLDRGLVQPPSASVTG